MSLHGTEGRLTFLNPLDLYDVCVIEVVGACLYQLVRPLPIRRDMSINRVEESPEQVYCEVTRVKGHYPSVVYKCLAQTAQQRFPLYFHSLSH